MKRSKSYILSTLTAVCMAAMVQSGHTIAFGGEIRVRPEYRDNADFNKDTTDTLSFIGSRLRLVTTAKALDDVLIKITLQDTRNYGGSSNFGGLTDSGEAVDIHEGYAEVQNVFKSPIAFRAGRQELVYGDQRLIGNFGWSNQGRAFDAFKFMVASGDYAMDAWLAKRRENNGVTAGSPNIDRDFYGIYSTLKTLIPKTPWDIYILFDREGDTANNARKKEFFTVGTRLNGKAETAPGNIDYTFELPYQFGDNGTTVGASSTAVKIEAFAFAGRMGFTFAGDSAIRLGMEYNFASGDDNAGDATARTFNNLYPTNHPFYGTMDYQGWRNMRAWNGNVSGNLFQKKLFLIASFWNFQLADAKDGWYAADGTAAGTARAAAAGNTETDVGNEVDILARYEYNMMVMFEAGWGHFLKGNLIKGRIANSGDSDWLYLMMTFKF